MDYETFFSEAPQMNLHTAKISGVICEHRVEQIEDPLMQKIRWLDKLVDELAKGIHHRHYLGCILFYGGRALPNPI